MDLLELREQIDEVDQDLVRLFCRRMEIAAKVADYKKRRIFLFITRNASRRFSGKSHRWQVRKWRMISGSSIPCCLN